MVPALDPSTGCLPLGRFNVSLIDVKGFFVNNPIFAGSTTRASIWKDFENATDLFRSAIPVVCVWIGGSFLTSKTDPDEFDLVYWIDRRESTKVTARKDLLVLDYFANNRLRTKANLKVDTYLGYWHLEPETQLTSHSDHEEYVMGRGFWDDFWMRKRNGPKGAAPILADAVPQRGYLEVTLDGFNGI